MRALNYTGALVSATHYSPKFKRQRGQDATEALWFRQQKVSLVFLNFPAGLNRKTSIK
jgi:hypothetical protein